MPFLNGVTEGKLTFKQAKTEGEVFNKDLRSTRNRNESEEQRKTLANINMLFNL